MVTLFVRVVGAGNPAGRKRVLSAAGDVDRIRGLVIAIDQRARRNASRAGVGRRVRARQRSSIHGLKCRCPSGLREIVIEHAKPRADHGLAVLAGRVGDSEARRELLMVVVRSMLFKRNIERLQRDVGRIVESGCVPKR